MEPASWYVEGEHRVLLKVANSVTDVTTDDLEEYKVAVACHAGQTVAPVGQLHQS